MMVHHLPIDTVKFYQKNKKAVYELVFSKLKLVENIKSL